MPVTAAGSVNQARFQKTVESEPDAELDSEDLDESSDGLLLYNCCLSVHRLYLGMLNKLRLVDIRI